MHIECKYTTFKHTHTHENYDFLNIVKNLKIKLKRKKSVTIESSLILSTD